MTAKPADIEDNLSNLLDDLAFREIDAQFRRFNLFEAVGAVRNELRHSNFLAYLLTPTRPHALGSVILERFLRNLIADLDKSERPVSILDIIVSDLDSAIVERERDNIDILIEISPLKLVIVIENKVGADVRSGQLAGYKNHIRNKYKEWQHLFVLLNPDGSRPDGDLDDRDYLTFSYSQLAELLEHYLIESKNTLSGEMAIILNNYVEALRRHIVNDTKLQEKARIIYAKHKEAFDFIFDNRPQPDDLLAPLIEKIGSNPSFVPDEPSPRRVRFALKEWSKIGELNACPPDKWTKSGKGLLFEIQVHRSNPRININLILGPGDKDFREFVFTEASKKIALFISMTKPLGRYTSTIYTRDLLSAGNAQSMDEAEKSIEIDAEWQRFLRVDLVSLESEIERIVHSYRNRSPSAVTGATE